MLSRILPHNEAVADRIIRVLLGFAVLSLVIVGPKTLWGLLGLVLVATGVAGTCPLYTVLGLSTCKTKAKTPSHATT